MRSNIYIAGLTLALLSGCASYPETTPNGYMEKFKEIDSRLGALETGLKATNSKHDADVAALQKADSEEMSRANAAYKLAESKADARFVFTTVLSDGSMKFASGRAELTKDAQAKLQDLAKQLQGDNKDVYLEIQGYADSSGSKESKHAIGLKRAEAVRQFLSEQGVALNRMSTVSFGDSNPVESNKTAAGRAANRRVVVVTVK